MPSLPLPTILYGAVTTGDIWQFGSFHRQNRAVTQDLMLYPVPTNLGSVDADINDDFDAKLNVGILQKTSDRP